MTTSDDDRQVIAVRLPTGAVVEAVVQRSGQWWAVEVPAVPGLYTQVRQLDQVAEMVIDAAELLANDDQGPDVFTMKLPDGTSVAAVDVGYVDLDQEEHYLGGERSSEAGAESLADDSRTDPAA